MDPLSPVGLSKVILILLMELNWCNEGKLGENIAVGNTQHYRIPVLVIIIIKDRAVMKINPRHA
jgi:hypothetical protein